MTTEIKNLDPDIVEAFKGLREAVKACEDNDRKQAKVAIDRIDADDDCRDKEVKRFREDADKIIQEMWKQFDTLKHNYEEKLRPHENVATNLHKVYTDTWQVVDQEVEPILTDIQQRQQQTHWTGPGAEAYMQQLPVQLAAVTEFRQYVQVAGYGVETPALLQHGAFQNFQILLSTWKEAISGYANTDTGEHYFQRCAWAGSALKQANDWFIANLMTGTDQWKEPLDEHVRQMTSSKVTTPEVLKNDVWPSATSGGDSSSVTPPTESKYTAPPEASQPAAPPSAERGEDEGLKDPDYRGGRSGGDGKGGWWT